MSTKIYTPNIDMIGNNPMFEARKPNSGPCRLFLKLEGQNPGGSIKDRMGLFMIEAAEQEEKIKPGGRGHGEHERRSRKIPSFLGKN